MKETQRKSDSPPAGVTTETNSKTANEFCSYQDSTSLSNYFFGVNILDWFTPEQLKAIVQDPMGNNEILRKISLLLYGTNGTYTNTVDYMTSMPTLDKVIVPHGKSTRAKKRNEELMRSTLEQIRDKEFIRDALFCGMIDGIAFYYFETAVRPLSNKKYLTDYDVHSITEINESGINSSIIALPTDYTMIVGRQNSSYVIAFNLDYFINGDGEPAESKIKKYPKEIRDAYAERWNTDNWRESGNWVVLDNSHTIVHKIRSKQREKWGRPLVLAAINDIMYGDYFTSTKRNVLDEVNNRIVYETFPEGSQKGTSALTDKQQKKQHDAVKSAVMNKNSRGAISFFSVSAGTKIDSIDASNTDLLDESYESDLNDRIALDFGIAGSLLNGCGSGTYSSQSSNLELLSSQIFTWIEQIEAELNKCISANVIKDKNNRVECKYLPITHVNKKELVDNARSLYLEGRGSITLWASACGISSDVFFALLDKELDEQVDTKYPVHQTSYTQTSSGTGEVGRPETDNPSDNTIKSQNNNGNDLPSPSDK